MTEFEIKSNIERLALLINIAKNIPVDEMLSLYSYNDTMGPFLDPTGWMSSANETRKNQRGFKALKAFLNEVKDIWPEFFEEDE